MVRGDYFKARTMRVTMKGIILVVILTCLSWANKTILTAPLVRVGTLTPPIWVSLSQILGIYLGLQFIEAIIDVIYFYILQGGWKSEFRVMIEPEEVTMEHVNAHSLKLHRDVEHLSADVSRLAEELEE